MMGVKEIEKVVIAAVADSGIVPLGSVFVEGDYPAGKVTRERAVVIVKDHTKGTYFNRGFVDVNFCVPDSGGRADHERLTEVESAAVEHFWEDTVGESGGTVYRYGHHSHGVHEDKDLGCHYANIRLLFETLNVR